MSEPMKDTVVVENARLELLRRLAWFREYMAKRRFDWPTHCPLWEDPWVNPESDILLAIREARLLGQIEGGPDYYRITDAGYDWIKTYDATGELNHECLRRASHQEDAE